jgi:phage repressor protein C with HTH and peptisase S24 domain
LSPSFDDVWERVRSATGIKTQQDLADALNIKSPSITGAKQRRAFPLEWAFKLALSHELSLDYLLRGEVPTKDRAEASQIRPPDAQPVACEEPLYVDSDDCRLAMIPMVEARLSAGSGSFEVGAGVERRYAFRMDFLMRKGQISQMVLMRVDGDSMEPHIQNGDVVLIDQSQTTPRAGGLFAVAVEDLVYLKVVDALPGKIILKSYNEAYAPLEIDARGDLADGIQIVGRAVWVGRELY